MTASSGLISTVHDYAQFDLALLNRIVVRPDTLAEAWRPPTDLAGRPLPHGLGWFVQQYGGDQVVWQFGTGDSGSSSIVITLPARGVSLIMAANSTGLVKSFALEKGDVTTSPFARIFLVAATRSVRRLVRVGLVGMLLALVPATARAEWQLKPFGGITFGGDTTFVNLDQEAGKPKLNLGVSGLWQGEIFGLEGDVATTAGFFSGDEKLILKSHVATVTGNLVVAMPKRIAQGRIAACTAFSDSE